MVKNIRTKTQLIVLLCLTIIGCSSCSLINPDEPIPAFFEINSIDLETQFGQGTASHAISTVWVYIDDKAIGAYELPAKFPVLNSGEHRVTISPGIKVNGISSTRGVYPFFEKFHFKLNIVQGETYVIDNIIDLTTHYSDDTEFSFTANGQEGFESGSVMMDTATGSKADIVSVPEPFEGSYSGMVHLHDSLNYFKVICTEDLTFNRQSNGHFLEMNFKCDSAISVGMHAIHNNGFIIKHDYLILNPTKGKWKKIYINFLPVVQKFPDAKYFKFFFEGVIPSGEAKYYFDNLKIVQAKS